MIKTFAFVLIAIFTDGSQERETLKSGISHAECAKLLTSALDVEIKGTFYAAKKAVVACEEELET